MWQRLAILGVLLAALASIASASSGVVGEGSARATARILYASDWAGPTEIVAVDPSGGKPVGQVTVGREPSCSVGLLACGFMDPIPSPDGRFVAYRSVLFFYWPYQGALWIARADGGLPKLVASQPVVSVSWSPDSRRLAYGFACLGVTPCGSGIHVVRADGSGDRVVSAASAKGTLAWSSDGRRVSVVTGSVSADGLWLGALSPDGRWRAEWQGTAGSIRGGDITVTDERTARTWLVRDAIDNAFVWSPDSRTLAYVGRAGVGAFSTASHTVRRLAPEGGFHLAWSPDSRSVAYIQGEIDPFGHSIETGDLRVATDQGRVRTVVARSGPFGGNIVSVAWTRQPVGLHYRPTASVNGIFAGGTVSWLAADGPRIAYVACRRVFVWTPGHGKPAEVASGARDQCLAPYDREQITDLALAGDRVGWAEKTAGLGFEWTVSQADVNAPGKAIILATGSGDLGGRLASGTGTLVGAGSLLVDSSWRFGYAGGKSVLLRQAVQRVDSGGCPCPEIASSPGPFNPLDVDAGRIVVAGDNATVLLDATGKQLLDFPVAALAAQLSGTELAILVRGQLRVYDTATGAKKHAWPLPDVTSGNDCGYYASPTCEGAATLRLEDVARGLAAYVLDGAVHLFRLADGRDVTVGPGTLARFMDAGLVYADGSRIHLVPYDRLPLQ
jgi:hypothetical protein